MFGKILNTPLIPQTFSSIKKFCIPFSYEFYLHQHLYIIYNNFQINMDKNKCRWMQKFKNVYIKQHFLIKQKDRYVSWWNVIFNIFTMYCNIKYILPCPQVKQHKNFTTLQRTMERSTQHVVQWNLLSFLCVLVSLYKWKIKFTSSFEYAG